MSPINRPHSNPSQSVFSGRALLEAEPVPNRPHSTPTTQAGGHGSLQARHQAAMDFISASSFQGMAAGPSRQRQVGGWTGGEANYSAFQQQQPDLDSDVVMSQKPHAPVSIAHGYDSDDNDRDALLRLSPTQLVSSLGRPEYVDDAYGSSSNSETTASSGWRMPNGLPTPNWLGMSPGLSGSDYPNQLGDGYGSMSSFEHEPESSSALYPSGKRPSFSFDASTLARTDSGTGTQSSFDAATPPNIFDEVSPGGASNANTMTTPSSSVTNSGPASTQSPEVATRSSSNRPTRKAAARAQQRYLSASNGLTTPSSSDASETVRGKSAVGKHASFVDSQGKFACPHPGCNKKFSTNGHAKRHSHAHLGELRSRLCFARAK